jgi:hypothetical protein
MRLPAMLLCAAVLASCGGGGGGGGGTPAPVPPGGPCTLQVVADTSLAAGKTGGASALACSGTLAEITWTQVSGPPVTLLSARSPTVAFEAATPGVVRLRADAQFADGTSTSSSAEVTILAAPAGSFVTVRADHSVRPGTDTSLRAWPSLAAGEALSGIVWTQVAGPAVTLDTSDQRLLMFKAPVVSADTVLKFRATMTTSGGRQDADDVSVAVERQSAAPEGAMFTTVARVHPYRAVGLYSSVLLKCTYDIGIYYLDSTRNNFCSSATLPLLQAEAGPAGMPTVAQIMGRVLVSHDFLGANFEQFLLNQDPHGDFRRLLAGAAAIVIGSHVRPSFYLAATGAIYLDANNLWLSAQQRDVVTEVPDYRLAFDDELNYSNFGRQVKNNNYARGSFPSTERVARTADELVTGLGRLLYHELAHAGDFFAPAERSLNPALSIWDNVAGRITARSLPSDVLAAQYPLTSPQMKALGQVLYLGATATAEQKAYSAADVGGFFSVDVANDDYAYAINGNSSSREDLAMLFEEFMMSYRHGIQYDIAFTNLYRDGMSNDQVIVGWGQRGRVADPRIRPRVKLVLQRVAPWIDPAAVDGLPAPILMRAGSSWEANLVLGASSALSGLRAQRIVPEQERAARLRDDLKKPRH